MNPSIHYFECISILFSSGLSFAIIRHLHFIFSYMSNPDFVFFLNNQAKFFSLYPKKYLLIKDERIIKAANSYKDAFLFAIHQGFKEGSYIIQESTKDLTDIAENFYSHNVSFK